MTPEEYQQFKEAEKEHLRKLKELKKAVGKLEREKSIRTAFENVSAGPADVLERQTELVDRLAIETAQHEARLEVAFESADEAAQEMEAAGLEEELQRDRAQALVRQLKRELEGGEERIEANDESQDDRRQEQDSAGGKAGATTTSEGQATTGGTSERARAEGATSERGGGVNEKRRDRSKEHDRTSDSSGAAKVTANPTSSRGDRPEKTIGRM